MSPEPDSTEPAPLVEAPITLDNGLTAARFTSSHPLGGLTSSAWQQVCTSDPCPGVRLTGSS